MRDFEIGHRVLIIEGRLTISGTVKDKYVHDSIPFYAIKTDFGVTRYVRGNENLACRVDRYLYDVDFKDKIRDRIK